MPQLDAGERAVLVRLVGHEPSARTSSSSHRRADTYGDSSVSALIEQYSVHTAAQPPSAFIPRNAACVHGFSTPKPVQCGTW